MRPFLSAIVAVTLILALGALAVMALPSAQGIAAPVLVSAAAPDAPAAIEKWTDVALPLTVHIDGTDAGTENNADEVASYIQSSCTVACPGAISKVARWRGDLQLWEVREVGTLFGGENFIVATGDSLLVAANSSLTTTTLSWVGDVPAVGSIHYSVDQDKWTYLMIPLDQSLVGAPALADDLAASIGPAVTKVSQWREDLQLWEVREVGTLFGGENFSVRLGYPYQVYSTATYAWPG